MIEIALKNLCNQEFVGYFSYILSQKYLVGEDLFQNFVCFFIEKKEIRRDRNVKNY